MSGSFIQPKKIPWARYPALRLACLFAAGILLGRWWDSTELFWPMLALLPLWGVLEYLHRRTLYPRWLRAALWCYMLAVVLAGGWRYQQSERAGSGRITAIQRTMRWEEVEVRGTIVQKRISSSGSRMLDLRVDSLALPSGAARRISSGMRVYVDSAAVVASRWNRWVPGDEMVMRVKLYPLEGPRNPGEFDYRSYLHDRGMQLHGGLVELETVSKSERGWSWAQWRRPLLNRIGRNFSGQNEALAQAVLLGRKQELSDRKRKAFSRAGLAHIMAVSGLHVGFLVAPFWLLLPLLRRNRVARWSGLAGLAALLVVYAGITGFPASVVRASLMAILLAAGKLFSYPADSVNLLGAAALSILAYDPTSLFDVGFQLSFAAVLLILLVWSTLQRMLPDRWRYNLRGKIAGVMGVSLVAQVGLFPLLAHYFNEFSVIGPLVNTVLLLPLGLLIQCCFVTLIIALPFPAWGAWLNSPFDWALGQISRLVELLSELQPAWIRVDSPGLLIFLIWVAGAAVLAGWHRPRLRWRSVSIVLGLLLLAQIQVTLQKSGNNQLEVTVLDVGQGDAAVIGTPSGRILVIDTGRWSPGSNSAERVLLPYLKSRGIHRVHALVLSHPHADHIGGAHALLRNMPVDTVYHSGYAYDSRIFQRYRTYCRENDIPLRELDAGMELGGDPAVQISTLGPSGRYRGRDPNEHSVVLMVRFGQTSFLFTGDAGRPQERRMLARYDSLINIDWLKAGHHGSRTASSAAFMNTATPDISVVSLGWDNRYGHPHVEAVRRLRQHSDTVYFASLEHAMRFVSNGETVWRAGF